MKIKIEQWGHAKLNFSLPEGLSVYIETDLAKEDLVQKLILKVPDVSSNISSVLSTVAS